MKKKLIKVKDLTYASGQKCPKCGAEVEFENELMFIARLTCINPKCDFSQDDW